jgi:lysophospholipase L1-like esterase
MQSLQRRRSWVLALATFFAVTSAPAFTQEKAKNDAIKPVPRTDKGWQQRHQRFLERAKQGHVDVLFLGDSITQGWEGNGKEVWKERFEPLHAANFGIGGDRTQHVLWRLEDGKELHGISPKAIVLMIGTNNMANDTAANIAEGVKAIVHELRQQSPEAKILLLGIFPRGREAANPFRAKIKDVNQRIAKLHDGKNVRYLDIGDKFLSADGSLSKEIMPDYLHLSAKGYGIWADAIQSALDEMVKN